MEITEQREVSPFDRIDFRGIGRVIISQGERQAVSVTASQAVMARVRTEVRGGVLIIALRWWLGMLLRIGELKTLEVRLTVEELAGLKVSGAGTVETRDRMQVQNLDIQLTGAGEIRLEIHGRTVNTHLTGAGQIVLWGQADEQDVHLTGAGSIQAERLVTRRASVRSSGAGECRVHAAESLEAKLSGAGSIRYAGNPRIESRITGLGSVRSI